MSKFKMFMLQATVYVIVYAITGAIMLVLWTRDIVKSWKEDMAYYGPFMIFNKRYWFEHPFC